MLQDFIIVHGMHTHTKIPTLPRQLLKRYSTKLTRYVHQNRSSMEDIRLSPSAQMHAEITATAKAIVQVTQLFPITSISLSVCLRTRLLKKLWNSFHETSLMDEAYTSDKSFRSLDGSKSEPGSTISFSTFPTWRDRTFLDINFRITVLKKL